MNHNTSPLRPKLGWWAPWTVTRPWVPSFWLGTDEYHNPSVSVFIPLLGAFHLWFRSWRDDTDGHFSLSPEMDAPDCPICLYYKETYSNLPKGWWWNPPRPNTVTRGISK